MIIAPIRSLSLVILIGIPLRLTCGSKQGSTLFDCENEGKNSEGRPPPCGRPRLRNDSSITLSLASTIRVCCSRDDGVFLDFSDQALSQEFFRHMRHCRHIFAVILPSATGTWTGTWRELIDTASI